MSTDVVGLVAEFGHGGSLAFLVLGSLFTWIWWSSGDEAIALIVGIPVTLILAWIAA